MHTQINEPPRAVCVWENTHGTIIYTVQIYTLNGICISTTYKYIHSDKRKPSHQIQQQPAAPPHSRQLNCHFCLCSSRDVISPLSKIHPRNVHHLHFGVKGGPEHWKCIHKYTFSYRKSMTNYCWKDVRANKHATQKEGTSLVLRPNRMPFTYKSHLVYQRNITYHISQNGSTNTRGEKRVRVWCSLPPCARPSTESRKGNGVVLHERATRGLL